MEDKAVRKLFTLLSACVINDNLMIQIVLKKMRKTEEYQLLSSLEQFHFLTYQGRKLEKRMWDFLDFKPDNLAATYNLLNNLTTLASEFKNVVKKSRISAEEPIDRPYGEVHILEKNYLQNRLDHDKRALEESEVYCLWQGRNNFVYESDAARQLKFEMDSFKCGTVTLADIRQAYVTLESFQSRFQQNRSGIITHQEYEQRENALNALIESKQKSTRYKKRIKILSIIISVMFIIVFSWDYYNQINFYNNAIKAVNSGDYKTFVSMISRIRNEKKIQEIASEMQEPYYNMVVSAVKTGDYRAAESMISRIRNEKKIQEITSEMQEPYYNMVVSAVKTGDYRAAESMILKIENTTKKREILSNLNKVLSAATDHTVGLKSDGTVVAVGNNNDGQLNVGSWKDIVAVSAGDFYTVGLKSDGTVVAVGSNRDGKLNVGSWKDIVAVSAATQHTVGLKSDGTVVAVGDNRGGQLNVGSWKDIVAVSAATQHTVGLKSDGTVVTVGDNSYGYVGSWKDIVAVSTGANNTVGLKSDGTVVAVGDYSYDKLNVGRWKDIVAVSVATVGLKSDGTVVAVGDNRGGQLKVGSWKYIVVLPIKSIK